MKSEKKQKVRGGAAISRYRQVQDENKRLTFWEIYVEGGGGYWIVCFRQMIEVQVTSQMFVDISGSAAKFAFQGVYSGAIIPS